MSWEARHRDVAEPDTDGVGDGLRLRHNARKEMHPTGGPGALAGRRKRTRRCTDLARGARCWAVRSGRGCFAGPLRERRHGAQAQAEGEGRVAGVQTEGDGPPRKQANQAESREEKKGKFIFPFPIFPKKFQNQF